MKQLLLVALGGGVGAVCRYGLSLLPISTKFPWGTLLANLAGALIIGFLAGWAARVSHFPPELNLLLKTGFCGGFTTFSTFSLEAVTLFQNGRYLLGGAYVLLSVALCVAGVLLGQCLARAVAHS